jgi:hypothetical protein
VVVDDVLVVSAPAPEPPLPSVVELLDEPHAPRAASATDMEMAPRTQAEDLFMLAVILS